MDAFRRPAGSSHRRVEHTVIHHYRKHSDCPRLRHPNRRFAESSCRIADQPDRIGCEVLLDLTDQEI
jgi:hypothetical protein